MKKVLNDKLIGKNIVTGQEWFMGHVYYIDIYRVGNMFFAKQKILYNTFSKRIEGRFINQEIRIGFDNYEIVKDDFDNYEI